MQKRITRFCSEINALSLEDYREKGGLQALASATEKGPEGIIAEIKAACLRGRGGAGFPAGMKWEMVMNKPDGKKYLVCNGDESEPGTFKDRFLMERAPFLVLEGMLIAAYAVGSDEAWIYVRGEYVDAGDTLEKAAGIFVEEGLNRIGEKEISLNIKRGAGSYLCGEETALLESLEGKAGIARLRPPFPADCGLWGKPTVVNNVETLANVPLIIAEGSEAYRGTGTAESNGTKVISISGKVARPGVYEVDFGTTLGEIIETCGGGIAAGKEFKFVQIGGAGGSCLPAEYLNTPFCYDAARDRGFELGSGAVLVADTAVSAPDFALAVSEFFAGESCGTCAPCREGNKQLVNILKKVNGEGGDAADVRKMERVCEALCNASRCGLGTVSGTALTSLLNFFPEEFIEGGKGYE